MPTQPKKQRTQGLSGEGGHGGADGRAGTLEDRARLGRYRDDLRRGVRRNLWRKQATWIYIYIYIPDSFTHTPTVLTAALVKLVHNMIRLSYLFRLKAFIRSLPVKPMPS